MPAPVRILIFHGYLLRGTGSNVYNASLVAALARLGHEVHLLCQDRHASELPFVDALGRWVDGELQIETIREPVRVTAYLPDIGETLPVYRADRALPDKTRLGPPGVDADAFVPRPIQDATAGLTAFASRLDGAETAGWGGEAGAAEALRSLDPSRDRIVSFVGKLIVSKGVDLLVAAWPLVTQAVPDARLVIVGFGTYREGIERLANALRDGDLEAAREIARRGRELEGGPPGELRYLLASLDRFDPASYLAPAQEGLGRIHFTGRLEHSDLPDLLAACEAMVIPSTWPEAFGM